MNNITIYQPNQRAKLGFINTWIIMIKDVLASWELIYQLWRRDFLMQYKKSFLGMGWVFISPILGIVSWVFMNATGVLDPGDVGIPYPAYVLISSSIFGLFMGLYTSASGTLQVGKSFIMQVNFPHHVLLFKQTFQELFNFLTTFLISIVVLFIFGALPSWKIIFFPFMILPFFFLAAALGLMVSVVEVVTPDLKKGFTFIMGLTKIITPIIYSDNIKDPLLQKVIKYNPLTYLIGGARDIVVFGELKHIDRYFICVGATILLFLVIWRMFYVLEEKVIEKMI